MRPKKPTAGAADRAVEPADAPTVDRVRETPTPLAQLLRLPGLLWTKMNLVLHAGMGMCAGNYRGINNLSHELVLRGPQQKCPHNPNEISTFRPELVLRDVPGKSTQRLRQSQRFRHSLPRGPALYPASDEVIRIVRTPRGLGLFAARRLAFWLPTSPLSHSHSCVGPEPAPTDCTGSLSSLRHCDLYITLPSLKRRSDVQLLIRWVTSGKQGVATSRERRSPRCMIRQRT